MNWQEVAASPALSLVGLVVGALSLITGFVFYHKSRRVRIPKYQVHTTTLVEGDSDQPDGLTFAFKGVPQNRVAVSKLLFWNQGKETIRRADLVAADPLRFTLRDAEILDLRVVASSASSCGIAVNAETAGTFIMTFDYLDHSDYALVQVVHTGSTNTRIDCSGRILGCRGPARYKDPFDDLQTIDKWTQWFMSRRVLRIAYFMLSAVLTSLAIYQLSRANQSWYVWLILVVGALYALPALVNLGGKPPVLLR
jgi:hypothetical protein